MKQIDMRFDQSVFRDMIGKCFEKYKADPFVYTPSVTQIVGIYIGDKIYKITNIQEPVDYFGTTDDEAVFKISCCKNSDIKSCFEDTEQINTPVNEVIRNIILINENQRIFLDGVQTYNVWLTRGIIFKFDHHEISFIKDSVPFSEEIEIQKGYDLIDKVSGTEIFLEGWGAEIKPECSREIISID